MMKLKSLNTFIILSLFMAISSCGGGSSVNNNKFNVNALISAEHPISNEERNIATRICYAYQSKSKNFRSPDSIGTNFIFNGKNSDCQGKATTYQVSSILKYKGIYDLIYESSTNLQFNPNVQTDSSGYLSQLCPKITTNQVISNTVDQQSVKVQISFFHEDLDGYFLQYFVKQPDNTYKIDRAEKLKVRSQANFMTGQILGMDEFYSTQKVCGDKFSNFEQIFISH